MKLERIIHGKNVLLMSIIVMLLVGVTMVNIASASPDTHFWLDPAIKTGVSPGSSFMLSMKIADAPSTYAWETYLSWDPALLKIGQPVGPSLLEGPWLKSTGKLTDFVYTPLSEANALGKIAIHCSIVGNVSIGSWPTGSGILCFLWFTVKGSGSTLLNLEDTRLWDHIGGDGYPASTFYRNEDCFFRNVATSHDIRITDVKVLTPEVEAGEPANINVTVLNEGTETETFDLTVYANETSIGTTTVSSLPGTGNSEARSFTYQVALDTTTEAVYTISAIATPVYGETDTADNTFTDGTVAVLRPPDLKVVAVTPLNPQAVVGKLVNITVAVLNEGSKPALFDIYVYANGTLFLTATFGKAVAVGATVVTTCYWQTWARPTAPAKEGTYIITAKVPPLPGEVDIFDNALTDGVVNVIYPCKLRDWEMKVNGKAGTGIGHKTTVGAINTLEAWVINNGPGNYSVWVKFYITDAVGNVVAVVTATNYPAKLTAGESTVLTGSWTATAPGKYLITARVFYGPVPFIFPIQFPYPTDVSLTQTIRVDTLPA